uniref:Uncharacterized protein n=1 Tax=Cacopsylla melanoneura TaxID=428564 RepID=A0A8D8S727_9HEMI
MSKNYLGGANMAAFYTSYTTCKRRHYFYGPELFETKNNIYFRIYSGPQWGICSPIRHCINCCTEVNCTNATEVRQNKKVKWQHWCSEQSKIKYNISVPTNSFDMICQTLCTYNTY